MKIWITYNDASSLWSSGLQCVFAWFRKPIYMGQIYSQAEYDDLPFGKMGSQNGYRKIGWQVQDSGRNGMWISQSLSVGSLFGYGDRENIDENLISDYIWKKVNDHFGKTPLGQDWKDLEHAGLSKPEDFCLELDVFMRLHHTQTKEFLDQIMIAKVDTFYEKFKQWKPQIRLANEVFTETYRMEIHPGKLLKTDEFQDWYCALIDEVHEKWPWYSVMCVSRYKQICKLKLKEIIYRKK